MKASKDSGTKSEKDHCRKRKITHATEKSMDVKAQQQQEKKTEVTAAWKPTTKCKDSDKDRDRWEWGKKAGW